MYKLRLYADDLYYVAARHLKKLMEFNDMDTFNVDQLRQILRSYDADLSSYTSGNIKDYHIAFHTKQGYTQYVMTFGGD